MSKPNLSKKFNSFLSKLSEICEACEESPGIGNVEDKLNEFNPKDTAEAKIIRELKEECRTCDGYPPKIKDYINMNYSLL